MDDGRLYVAELPFCPVHGEGCFIRLLQEAGVVDMNCHSTTTATANCCCCFLEINLISNWFLMIVCFCLVENCVSILFGSGVKLEFGGGAL